MICMYADDTAILSRHYDPNTLTQNINVHLAHLETWFSVWKIAINTSKTEAISFSQKRPPPKSRSKTKGYPGLYTPNTLVSLLIKTSRSDNILHTPRKLMDGTGHPLHTLGIFDVKDAPHTDKPVVENVDKIPEITEVDRHRVQAAQTVSKPGLTARKVLLCIWRDWKGISYYELLPYGQTLNSDLYCQQMDRFKPAIDQKWPELANRRGVVFHQENDTPHVS
ncbi:mariner transposase [Trichonephila clavipes]|nr:mariner transposase [Trichonephila clavipes]